MRSNSESDIHSLLLTYTFTALILIIHIAETPLVAEQLLDSSVVQVPAAEEGDTSYLINGYRRDWYDILRTKDVNRGYISSTTTSGELPPPKKRRRRQRPPPSPVFGSPPNIKRSIQRTSPTELDRAHSISEIPSEQVNTTENLGDTPLLETEQLVLSLEKYWIQKINAGADAPIWWMQRKKYMMGVVQRVRDVKNFEIYPVAKPGDLKVC